MASGSDEELTKTIHNFLDHVAIRGKVRDTSADVEAGEDTHYYELDARIMDPLIIELRRLMASRNGCDT